MTHEGKEQGQQIHIVTSWQQVDVPYMHQVLELPNWAPWLAASAETLSQRAEVFPLGQLVVVDAKKEPLASLSMNKIWWDGDVATLPSWDQVAGDPTTYENTYDPNGNTLVMMSMNVSPKHQGEGFARKLIEQAKLLAIKQDVDHLIGSFRPNEYGTYKLAHMDAIPDFETYCNMQRADGLPVDSWIRNLTRNGMQPLSVDPKAMIVPMPLEEFNAFFDKSTWKETQEGMFECGEVGTWTILGNQAVYQESNLWGLIWKK